MKTIRQKQKEIWCALERRNSDGIEKVRLVQRPQTVSLMAGMWELPQTPHPPTRRKNAVHWRTFRHSITVTDYTVHVLRSEVLPSESSRNRRPAAKDKWVPVDRIPQIPITGLTRKILKAGGII